MGERMGRPTAVIELSGEERETLERWARRPKSAQALAMRCRIVLAAAEGRYNRDIAVELGCHPATVGKWRGRFALGRLDGLADDPRPGPPRKITDAMVEEVIVKTLEQAPPDATHWSTRSMAEAMGISQTSVSQIWRAFGIKPHVVEESKVSPDPQFIDKTRDVVGLYLDPPEAAVVICVDEKTQALDRTAPILPLMPGTPQRRTHDYRRYGTTNLFDAVATQDTVTMISAQIRRVRKLAPRAAALVLAHDYDSRAKPVCDWDDPDERSWLIDDLVTDAGAVLDALEGERLSDEQAQAAALLAVVAGQDVEADPEVPGRWRIARRVAPGRVISTVDPEARHARKSRSQRRDGYKAHICAEPDTGPITAVELTTADTSDAQVGPRLLQQDPTAPHNTTDTDTGSDTTDTTDTTDTGSDTDTADVGDVGAEGFVGLVLADSAYASGEALDAFAAAGYGTAIKPIDRKPRIAGGFTRDDFTIDTDAQTVTCPAGHTKAIKSGAARFGALCGGCPLRARCTTSAAGRSVTVDEHHQRRQANKTRFAQPATQAAYRRHRPMAERSIAWLTRNKARRVPYRGVAANHLWLTTRAAAVNLTRLTNLGLTHTGGTFTL